MRMPLSSRLLFLFLGLALPLGAHLADVSASHLFNANWPPHAKFHTGHTLGMSLLLGAGTILFAWRRTEDRFTAVLTTSLFAALYWLTQGAAILYPNTAYIDPDQNLPLRSVLGLPGQVLIQAFFLSLTGIAAWLALRPGAKWARAESGEQADLARVS